MLLFCVMADVRIDCVQQLQCSKAMLQRMCQHSTPHGRAGQNVMESHTAHAHAFYTAATLCWFNDRNIMLVSISIKTSLQLKGGSACTPQSEAHVCVRLHA